MGDKLQRLVLFLRKVGILRAGTKTYTYTSAKDMPTNAILDDVYDEDKDLLFKKDASKK